MRYAFIILLVLAAIEYRDRMIRAHRQRMDALKNLMIDSFRTAAKMCEEYPVRAAVFLNLQAETLENDLTDEAVEKAKKIINKT
jgi:hypothetical protein